MTCFLGSRLTLALPPGCAGAEGLVNDLAEPGLNASLSKPWTSQTPLIFFVAASGARRVRIGMEATVPGRSKGLDTIRMQFEATTQVAMADPNVLDIPSVRLSPRAARPRLPHPGAELGRRQTTLSDRPNRPRHHRTRLEAQS